MKLECHLTTFVSLYSLMRQGQTCGPAPGANNGGGSTTKIINGGNKPGPDPALAPQCAALACNFADSGGPCKYTINSGNPKWAYFNKLIGNRDTGVSSADRGKSSYLGVPLLPNQSAVLTSPDVSFTQQKSLLVRYHEATDGIVLAVCSNDLNTCQDVSNLDATKGDRNWRDGAATITTATKKILIIAKNVGPNVGAVGISSIGIGNSEPGSRNRC